VSEHEGATIEWSPAAELAATVGEGDAEDPSMEWMIVVHGDGEGARRFPNVGALADFLASRYARDGIASGSALLYRVEVE
jgi:hypothetical protein